MRSIISTAESPSAMLQSHHSQPAERIAGWLLDFDARLGETAADQPSEERAAIESFAEAANKPPKGLMEATPALYVVASRALWQLRGMDDDLEAHTAAGAALCRRWPTRRDMSRRP